MDGVVDGENASRAEGGSESDVKPGVLSSRGRGCQIEIDAGSRPDVGCPGGYGRLAIVPVRAGVTGPHDKTDPVGVLGRIGHKGAPSRRNVIGGAARIGRQDTAIGRRLMFPVVEFVRIPVRRADFPHRRSQSKRRPSKGAHVQGLARGHGDVRVFIGADHTGAESPEVIGAGRHVRNSESTTCARLDPELVG